MSNHQPPTWAQSAPPVPPVPPKSGIPRGAKITLGIFAAFGIIGGCNAIISDGKGVGDQSAAAPAPSAPPATSSPEPTSSAPSPAAPSPSKATAAGQLPTLPSPTLAPADARKKAATILRANDAYYQDEFNKGVDVITARGTDGSFDAFHTWYQRAATDAQPGIDAFKQADGYFDASDEPSSISDWRDDNGILAADVAGLANDGLDVGGPGDEQARRRIQADIAEMQQDFATVEQDAAKVEAGK
ncbi:hypothetical protein [Kitasatospora sp. NPDC001175]|uniref:hypothetical protein n=1 Tax=Kitasatospora sp. NPDC001175 TaxID=3157103 RepID=UPI003D01D86F